MGLTAQRAFGGQWRRAGKLIGLFTAGATAAVLPFVVWFAARGALWDLWYGLIGINLSYTGGAGLLGSIFHREKLALALLLTVGLIALSASRRRSLLWVCAPAAAVELMLMGYPMFFHYYIVLLPLLAVCYAAAFVAPRRIGLPVWAVLLLCPQTYEMRPLGRMARKSAVQQVSIIRSAQQPEAALYSDTGKLLGNIPPDERDSVWVCNFGQYPNTLLYQAIVHEGIVQCNRIMYDSGIPLLNHQALADAATPVPWVLVAHTPDNPMASDSAFLAGYELAGLCRVHYPLYENLAGQSAHISLWHHRKSGLSTLSKANTSRSTSSLFEAHLSGIYGDAGNR